MVAASGGSGLILDRAYVDQEAGRAVCCWSAPDRAAVEGLFARARVKPETIREVVAYPA